MENYIFLFIIFCSHMGWLGVIRVIGMEIGHLFPGGSFLPRTAPRRLMRATYPVIFQRLGREVLRVRQ